jgi:DNA processing protein
MTKNLPYYLGFSFKNGIGPLKFDRLLAKYGSVSAAYEGEISDFDPVKVQDELRKKIIKVITREDPLYPEPLKNIPDPPICLYVRGDIKKFNEFAIGIVGTRKPTSYGTQIARKFGIDLATAGFVIVSGLAMGIDAVAHQAALDAGGPTIAVLGCGVDIVYPAINHRLYEQIIAGGGAVISEFPPGMQTLPGLFIARNRIISGLSKGVLVVEGAADSGALITARYAAEQGREVFAPPAPINSEMSAAPNNLLKTGAKLVTSIDDILSEFNLKIIPKIQDELKRDLTGMEGEIFETLKQEPRFIDEIVATTQKSVNKILNSLSILEIKGIIEKNSEGRYQIKI